MAHNIRKLIEKLVLAINNSREWIRSGLTLETGVFFSSETAIYMPIHDITAISRGYHAELRIQLFWASRNG